MNTIDITKGELKDVDIYNIGFINYSYELQIDNKWAMYYFDKEQGLQRAPYDKVERISDEGFTCPSGQKHFLKSRIFSMPLGTRWEDALPMIENAYAESHPTEDIDKCTTTFKVRLERTPENKNKKTFDFVKVEIPLVLVAEYTDYKSLYKALRPQIIERAIDKIMNSKNFISKGVPVNFLKLTSELLYKDGVVELIFELKELEAQDEKL